MRIALPMAGDCVAGHFGHCETFCLIDVDTESRTVVKTKKAEPPPHQPGILPAWLSDNDVGVVIAGGMGRRAQALFDREGIEVVVGAPSTPPQAVVEDYLAGRLQTGENPCDH